MSHEFNLKIKLEDKNFCNGCPCLDITYYACKAFKQNVAIGNERLTARDGYDVIRPELCKENEVRND